MINRHKRGANIVDKYICQKHINLGLLFLMIVALVLVPQVSATSAYNVALQNVYGIKGCNICHIGPVGDVVLTTYGSNFSSQENYSDDPETALIAIGPPPDTLSPVINSVNLDAYMPNTGDDILITVNATDNIGVVNVAADIYGVSNVGVSNIAIDHIELDQNEDVWSGTIVARNGTYLAKVSASDAAGNVAWNNSTRYTATDRQTVAFEFGVSNLALTVEQNVSATYVLTIKNTGQLSDTYNLTVDSPNNATVNISKKSISLGPGQNSTAILTVSSAITGTYDVNVTATSRADPSENITVNTKTTVVVPSYIKAFYVGSGTRAGSISAYVKVTNLANVGHWFAVVIGGIDPITGYPLVGTGTLYLGANQTAEKVPVLITVPAETKVGTYQLYVGIYNYDTGLLNQSTLIGTIQGPKPSTVS